MSRERARRREASESGAGDDAAAGPAGYEPAAGAVGADSAGYEPAAGAVGADSAGDDTSARAVGAGSAGADTSAGASAQRHDAGGATAATAEDVRRLEQELQDAYANLRVAEDKINTLIGLEGSGAYRLGRLVATTSRKAAPHGSARRRALTNVLSAAKEARTDPRLLLTRGPRLDGADLRWNRFCKRHDPSTAQLQRMRESARTWTPQPLVSIIMPTYDPRPKFLRAAIDSVRAQAYERWELCIVDDGSPTNAAAKVIAGYARESRIRFTERRVNQGIAIASQAAADMTTGELLAFLDHDDVLRPHALFDMVKHVREHPACDLVYSDEDRVDPWGRRVWAHLKPDWSPELMDSCNYMCHLTVIRRDLFDRAGGFRPGFDGAQDYDLFLRCAELASEVGHVREVLYGWRMHEGSVASTGLAKPEAFVAGARVLEDRLVRAGETGTVVEGAWKGVYQMRRAVAGAPSIGVVIPTRDAVDLLRESVACVEREAADRDVRLVIVDNDSTDPATHEYLRHSGYEVVPGPGSFNFSRLVNIGVAAAGAVDHVLLLNNDITGAEPGWLDAMLEHSQRDGIGAVGARLLFEDGTPQHEGIRVGAEGGAAINLDLSAYFGMGLACRTVSAVTGACLMVKRALWEEMDGFDETLRVAFNDVDFCLRLMRAGYRNVYTPVAELTHKESATRGRRHPAEDERRFVSRWGPFAQGYDRYIGEHIWSFTPVSYR
jgi:GT2 family glycosyltransferase